jgi:hypothetical protein
MPIVEDYHQRTAERLRSKRPKSSSFDKTRRCVAYDTITTTRQVVNSTQVNGTRDRFSPAITAD